MKYRDIQIAEASVANIRVIKQLTDAIWSSLPEVPEGTVKDVYLSQLSGFNRIHRVYANDPEFAKPMQVMETTRLRIVNSDDYEDPHYQKGEVWGYHDYNNNLMLVWLSNIRNTSYSHAITKHARSVLAHEIRHLFQYALYPRYFNSRQAYKKSYTKQQIEIDAVWTQLVSVETDIEDYRGYPQEFVDEIMVPLAQRRELTSQEIQHYRRKTLKYYRQFFDENTEAEWKRIVNSWGRELHNTSVENFVGDVVQELDSYLERRFDNPQIKKKILDYYSGETRRAYKQLTAGPRKERKKSAIINQLIPLWEKITDLYRDQWGDPTFGALRLAQAVNHEMDSAMQQAAGSDPNLYKELSVWFLKLTRDRIEMFRSWHAPRTAAAQGPK